MSLKSMIVNVGETQALKRLQKAVVPLQTQANEKILIENLHDCLDFLAAQNEFNKTQIVGTLQHIIQGQLFDLYYFSNSYRVIAIMSDEDLEKYIYQVAGCVGEFWTNMCFQYIDNFSNESKDLLVPKAINFGKGLQLTNILRDIPADIKLGRLYLPIELSELCINPQVAMEQVINNKSIFFDYLNKTKQYLTDGWDYTRAIKNRRIRFACLMPIYIAKETLALLEDANYLQQPQMTKISRQSVYWLMMTSLLAANNFKFDEYFYHRRIP